MVANGLSKLTQATVSAGNCLAAHAMRLAWHINGQSGCTGCCVWSVGKGCAGVSGCWRRQSDAPAMFSVWLTS